MASPKIMKQHLGTCRINKLNNTRRAKKATSVSTTS